MAGFAALALHVPNASPAVYDVDVLVPHQRSMRAQPGLRIRRADLHITDLCLVGRTRVTTPVRTAFDIARFADQTEAVVALDALWRARLTSADELRAYAAARPRLRGVSRVSVVCDLADPGSESPMETRLRLLLVRAGLPRPATQHNVYDDQGRFAGRVDMAYPDHRVAIEYDGEYHFERHAHANDRRRHNTLTRAGWTVLYFTAADVYQRPEMVVAEVARVISVA